MNESEKDRALRKEILLARSSLCRLKIRYEAQALRAGLSWRGAGAAVAGSQPAREMIFLLAAEGLGRVRAARWLAYAARALAMARLGGLALSALRRQTDATGRDPAP